jgi:hypothetical protein
MNDLVALLTAAPGEPIRLDSYHVMQQLQYQQLQLAQYAEPEIPSRMDDWDKEFWLATGIIVPGTTCKDLI